ncbi:MAG: hypothetical protein EXR50_05485 [Dehalococcoidia bacterium]|nr:hypothetical protein [Dehalococcoidia bacterium]
MDVRESTRWVVEHCQLVSIDEEATSALAQKWAREGFKVPDWDQKYHYSGPPEMTANFILLLDTLNFCFWEEPKWEIEFKGETLSGYWALAASLTRAVQEGIPVLDTKYWASIGYLDAGYIFRGNGDIPMRSERCGILRVVGKAMEQKYGGQFIKVINAAEGSAPRLLDLIAREVPFFSDTANYKGQKVLFYKRAQILVADLWGAFGGKGLGAFAEMEQLTAFADYKLPQVLRELGVLQYAEPLAKKIDALEPLPSGSSEEVEIRACTIWAVELLKQALKELGIDLPSFQIDWCLWDMGQKMPLANPHHRTKTIFY